MADAFADCIAITERCASGALSPEVALMEMLLASEDVALVERVLARHGTPALAQCFARQRAGCEQIAAILRAEQVAGALRTPADSIAFHRQLFDTLVQQNEEASVALYSLGSADILASATREIVDHARRAGWLGRDVRVLDMGTGIGRIASALAPLVHSVEGIDISARMVEAATRRCADLSNVRISPCSGSDLSSFANEAFELVLAVDSFPYVVQAGDTLVDAIFAEVVRVLTAGGRFSILNFSYRDDLALDRRDAGRLALAHGLRVDVSGAQPFELWNGSVFSFIRR